jgi:predicted tellurium resistance membrane protein TerC
MGDETIPPVETESTTQIISNDGGNEGQINPEPQELTSEQKKVVFIGILLVGLLVILIAFSLFYLLQPTTDTARIRDIFIIFLAIESLLIGLTLVVLMIQLAKLLNLLQNEIRPIVESTNETVSNLRGTTTFLSDNLVEPVIKVNEFTAGFRQLIAVIGLTRGRTKKK